MCSSQDTDRNINFTDEKILIIEEHYNKQNDKMYAHISKEAAQVIIKLQCDHQPPSCIIDILLGRILSSHHKIKFRRMFQIQSWIT